MLRAGAANRHRRLCIPNEQEALAFSVFSLFFPAFLFPILFFVLFAASPLIGGGAVFLWARTGRGRMKS